MSKYDCYYDLIIRVEDPNGIELNDRMVEAVGALNEIIMKKYPVSAVFPRGFKIVKEPEDEIK